MHVLGTVSICGNVFPEACLNQRPESAESTRYWVGLAIVLVLVVVRMGFAALAFNRPELAQANDTDRYVPVANAILSGEAFAPNNDRPGLLVNTAGYPFFLAGIFAFGGHNAGSIATVQLLLSGLLVVIVYA